MQLILFFVCIYTVHYYFYFIFLNARGAFLTAQIKDKENCHVVDFSLALLGGNSLAEVLLDTGPW